MFKIEWLEVSDYSIREAAASVGIDRVFFDKLTAKLEKTIDKEVRKLIVRNYMKHIEGEWSDKFDIKLGEVKYGVYVISLGRGFEIDYSSDKNPIDKNATGSVTYFQSPVLYIGKGALKSRITSHLRGKLFEFWKSIGSVPLRIHLTSCEGSDHADPALVCKSLESHLLDAFDERVPEKRIDPLLNKNKGVQEPLSRMEFASGWDKPIKRYGLGKTTSWLMRPGDMGLWKGQLD